MPVRSCAGLAVALLLVTGCTQAEPEATLPPASPQPSLTESPATAPALQVEAVADGLDHAWDVVQAPDGTLLVDERSGGFTAVLPDGSVREVDADFGDLFATGETGLMGLALDPAFADNRRFYSCQGVRAEVDASIAVIAWTAAADWSSAERVADHSSAGSQSMSARAGTAAAGSGSTTRARC